MRHVAAAVRARLRLVGTGSQPPLGACGSPGQPGVSRPAGRPVGDPDSQPAIQPASQPRAVHGSYIQPTMQRTQVPAVSPVRYQCGRVRASRRVAYRHCLPSGLKKPRVKPNDPSERKEKREATAELSSDRQRQEGVREGGSSGWSAGMGARGAGSCSFSFILFSCSWTGKRRRTSPTVRQLGTI